MITDSSKYQVILEFYIRHSGNLFTPLKKKDLSLEIIRTLESFKKVNSAYWLLGCRLEETRLPPEHFKSLERLTVEKCIPQF